MIRAVMAQKPLSSLPACVQGGAQPPAYPGDSSFGQVIKIKLKMKTNSIRSLAGASLLALGLVTSAVAVPITGSISFTGSPIFNSSPISGATEITGYNSAYIAVDQQTGDYAALPDLFPVTFNPFVFSPPDQTVSPLWTFDYDGRTYSAWVTSMVSSFNAALKIWNFGGSGYLSITGFENTAAEWNFSAGQIGGADYFGSAAAAIQTVPDTGATLLMLAGGLVCLMAAGRVRLSRVGKPAGGQHLPQLLG
jgi:hypothetical protein